VLEAGKRERHPFARLAIELGVLTGGGWLLSDGLHAVVRHLGITPTLVGNTALAGSVEAEELARVAVSARRLPHRRDPALRLTATRPRMDAADADPCRPTC
jgi:hypothetical protein